MRIESVTNALKEAEQLAKRTENIEKVFDRNNFQEVIDHLSLSLLL